MSTNINKLRKELVANPLATVPEWTVAAFDPTTGDLPRRSMDKEKTRLYLQALADAGAPGVLLAASTGWGHARNFQEHRQTLLTGGEIELNGCLKQALLRMEDPLEQNLALLNELAGLDYGIVWTRRGSQLPPTATDEEVAEKMLPLVKGAAEKGLPVGIYSISTVDGAPLAPGAAKKLLQLLGEALAEQVVAIKITEPDFVNSTRAYLNDPAFAGKKIVQGWDAFYADAMKAGRQHDGSNHCGATSGAAACMVYCYKAMHEATKAGDWQQLEELQTVLSEVFYSMQGPDKNLFPDLQIAKWVMGLGHPLTETRSPESAEPLMACLQRLSQKPERTAAVGLILKSLLLLAENTAVELPLKQQLQDLHNPEL